jgi:hypothetical protein
MKRMMWLAIAVTFSACGSKDSESKSDPAAKQGPPPATAKATVSITVTGAVDKTFSGEVGLCTIPEVDGKRSGATYKVDDGKHELTITAVTDKDLTAPKVFLRRIEQRQGYALKAEPATMKLDPGRSAEFETDLMLGDSIEGTVHVKGTITCLAG